MASERDVRAQLQQAGQDHLLRFWADLAPEPQAALLAELASLDADALREHCQRASAAGALAPGPLPDLAARLQPLPPERVGSAIRCDQETRLRWEEEGRHRRTRRRLGKRWPLRPTGVGGVVAEWRGRTREVLRRVICLSAPSSCV